MKENNYQKVEDCDEQVAVSELDNDDGDGSGMDGGKAWAY